MRSFIVLAIAVFLLPDIAHAATEYATFESFYKESSAIGWILAAVVALIFGAVIFFTGGTASPIVVGIGSWVGGMMGLSGIAATNAGLALLGGGSIASGGFGIIGGTVLLTAALSFGTDIVVDYTIGKAVSEYKYSNLTEHSKKMPTLPLPMNDSGPDAFENAVEILEGVDKESPIFSSKNQQVIRQAITELETTQDTSDADESSKNNSLLSLLYFVSNDYVYAKAYANMAIQSARESKIKRTLPAFIYATSTLYEESFDFELITDNYFSYAILAEPDNPLIPLLFSIYLDRILLRFNDGYLGEKSLSQVFSVMKSSSLDDTRTLNYTVLLSRYFIRLKLEQQKVASLSTSSNETIKKSKKTLDTVIDSLRRYNILISDSNDVMSHFLALDLEDEDRVKAAEFHGLLVSYIQDKERLASLVDDLRNYQDNLLKVDPMSGEVGNDESNWSYIVLVMFVIFGFMFVKKRT